MRIIKENNGTKTIYKDEFNFFYHSLMDGSIDFSVLVNHYVKYLEIENYKNQKQLVEADMPLVMAYDRHGNVNDEDIKNLIARYLIKHKRYDTAPINKELEKRVEEHKLNIEGSFLNDLYLEEDK